jgi:hypothetical protein
VATAQGPIVARWTLCAVRAGDAARVALQALTAKGAGATGQGASQGACCRGGAEHYMREVGVWAEGEEAPENTPKNTNLEWTVASTSQRRR